MGKSGFSDIYEPLPLPNKVTVHQFPKGYDPNELQSLYKRQVRCSMYGGMFLRMHFLHLSQKRIIQDYHDMDLLTWLRERKRSKKDWGRGKWWPTIKEEFIAIFKPVFQGLKRMHLRNEYHGKLSINNGIKIQVHGKHVRGVLTHMEIQDATLDVKARKE
ncbi:hypothetical protein PIB30_112886, partial [Stylosanthes scabra]|nr:hypothetical protein [Stylosanthes scabra]